MRPALILGALGVLAVAALGLGGLPSLDFEGGDGEDVFNRVTMRTLVEPLRALVPDLRVTSGHRTEDENAATPGSSSTSQHVKGTAVDVKSDTVSAGALLLLAIEAGLPIDQGIAYAVSRGGHVHLSTVLPGGTLRRMYGIAPSSGGYRWGIDQVRALQATPTLS